MEAEEAEAIALSALAFLAEDAGRLGRFLALTGVGAGALREGARSHRFLAAVLDHLLQDEGLLLVFASSRDLAPGQIAPARDVLERQDGGAGTRRGDGG